MVNNYTNFGKWCIPHQRLSDIDPYRLQHVEGGGGYMMGSKMGLYIIPQWQPPLIITFIKTRQSPPWDIKHLLPPVYSV